MENISFEKVFEKRNPKYTFLISRMRCAMDLNEVTFKDINSVNLRLFKDYMEGEVSNNSLKTYMAVVKATISELFNDGLIENGKCISVLKVKADPQQNVCLSDDEIKLFEDYYNRLDNSVHNRVKKDVLTLFLIEIFTGARGCDVENFTPENICNGTLTYVSKKTHTLTTLPAHKMLPTLIKNIPKRKYQRMTKNRIIKQIGKECGINQNVSLFYHGKQRTLPKYEYLAFHCARRSFVSSLIDRGVPISAVSKMAGHSDISITQRYYVSQTFDLPDEALSFFND